MSIFRGASESFSDYELRFGIRFAKFNARGGSVALSEAISALMLLANAGVDSALRISILAAAAPKEASLTARMSINGSIPATGYETVASMLLQCEKNTLLSGFSAGAPHRTVAGSPGANSIRMDTNSSSSRRSTRVK